MLYRQTDAGYYWRNINRNDNADALGIRLVGAKGESEIPKFRSAPKDFNYAVVLAQ